MSASDSRKAFLTKLCLCLAAVATVPGLLRRRRSALAAASSDQQGASGFAVKPDSRAVARNDANL